MSYLFAILLFSFLIFIHELGHFLAAKLFGVQVNEFSLFMGPVLFQKQIGQTVYSVRCIPIGGFCAMEGEDGEGQTDNPGAFPNAAWWKRCIILVAGAAMNLLAGALLLLGVPPEALDAGSYEDPLPEDSSLARRVDALPPEAATIVKLRFYEDLSLKEISQIVDCPLSTVKTRLYTGLKKLRIAVEGEV